MRDEELDRVLSAEGGIVPSSGFTAAVMEAVRREAATPPPLPFPWKRALPGLLICVALLVLAGISRMPAGIPALPDAGGLVSLATAALTSAARLGAGWVALALLLTVGSVALSRRLTGWRG